MLLDTGIEYVSVHKFPGGGLTRSPEPDARIRIIPTAMMPQMATMKGLWFILLYRHRQGCVLYKNLLRLPTTLAPYGEN